MNKENLKIYLGKLKVFIRKYYLDVVIMIFLFFTLYSQWISIKFIYKSNIIVLRFIIPLLLMFLWINMRSHLDKSNLLSTASIVIAVFIFLFSIALNDDSKIKLLSGINDYNCNITKNILTLKEKTDLSSNFTLNYFIVQPYLDNTSFILQRLGTITGTELLVSVYDAQGANSLINQIQGLNIQGINPSFGSFIAGSIKMYNSQLIEIASSTSLVFCNKLF